MPVSVTRLAWGSILTLKPFAQHVEALFIPDYRGRTLFCPYSNQATSFQELEPSLERNLIRMARILCIARKTTKNRSFNTKNRKGHGVESG
jgi:hypothetical protein